MNGQKTSLGIPVLHTPVLEPVGVEGCDVCGALVGQREAARERGARDAVSRCNAELRAHPHPDS